MVLRRRNADVFAEARQRPLLARSPRRVGMVEKGSLLNRRALSISAVAVQTTWPPCDGATPLSRRRLDGALSSSLLDEGGHLGCGEGGAVAASQRAMCMRDWPQRRTSPRRLGNGTRPSEGPRKGCLGSKRGPWPIDEIV